jgi:hypothetical protein
VEESVYVGMNHNSSFHRRKSCGHAARCDVERISPELQQQLFAWLSRARARVLHERTVRFQRRRLLMPDSRARAAWDILNLALMTYTVFEIPYSMLFLDQQQACAWDWPMLVNLVVDILFMSDIAVTFHTAFYDNDGFLIEDHMKIAVHYFRSWFLLDVASSMPLDALICTFDKEAADPSILRLIKGLRLAKLARMAKFFKIIRKWEIASGSNAILRTALRVSKILCFMLCSVHLAACLWMAVVFLSNDCFEQDLVDGRCLCVQSVQVGGDDDEPVGHCQNRNWLTKYEPEILERNSEERAAAKYLASSYFAVVALTTVGFGDITPTNDVERVCALVLALGGAVVFAFCIGASLSATSMCVALASLSATSVCAALASDTEEPSRDSDSAEVHVYVFFFFFA